MFRYDYDVKERVDFLIRNIEVSREDNNKEALTETYGESIAYAHNILKKAADDGDIESAYNAARLYAKISPNKLSKKWVREKLGESYTKAKTIFHNEDKARDYHSKIEELVKEAEEYVELEKLPESEAKKIFLGSFGKVFGFVFIIIGLLFSAPLITGNVVGINSSQNITGAILFIVGAGLLIFTTKRDSKTGKDLKDLENVVFTQKTLKELNAINPNRQYELADEKGERVVIEVTCPIPSVPPPDEPPDKDYTDKARKELIQEIRHKGYDGLINYEQFRSDYKIRSRAYPFIDWKGQRGHNFKFSGVPIRRKKK